MPEKKARKPKVGDWYLAPMKITRISDDGFHVTLDLKAYGSRITIPASSLDDWERIDESA